MSEDLCRLVIHGARGSWPVSGRAYQRHGGHTSCFSVETPDGLLMIDAGSGLAQLGRLLERRATLPPMTLLLTHVHLDHILGLPAFRPLYRRGAQLTIIIEPSWRPVLEQLVSPPLWPVALADCGATIRMEPFAAAVTECYGITVTRCAVSHPQGGLAYRLATPTQTFVLASDREHGDAALDAVFLSFCRGADVLLHDAQYTPEEWAERRGWGHSTFEQAAQVARAAGVRRLVLVSHDPNRTDEEIDRITARACALFPKTAAGTELMELSVDPDGPRATDTIQRQGTRASPAEPPIAFTYDFRFFDGARTTFRVELDPLSLQASLPPRTSLPSWTALPHLQCPNCPLTPRESPQCPAAVSLIDVVDYFGHAQSIDCVELTVSSAERRYVKECSLQEALGSLVGLSLATSGCPVMAKLRPMARFHLPFATMEETRYRTLSTYLLAQYLLAQRGGAPDWELKALLRFYESLAMVNIRFSKRLGSAVSEDASLNALVRLDAFADTIAFTVDQQLLQEVEQLFGSYLNEGPAHRPE